jgi:hypothetical protein
VDNDYTRPPIQMVHVLTHSHGIEFTAIKKARSLIYFKSQPSIYDQMV